MFKKSTIFRLFSLLLIAGMVFAALPAADVQAAVSGETLYVANWTTHGNVGVNGRPTVIKYNDTYHLWYGVADTSLYHATSTDPASFPTGAITNFVDSDGLTSYTPYEVASPAIIEVSGTFYMVNYKAGTNLVFSLYSSNNGDTWTYIKDVLDCSVFPAGTYNKFDAPFLFNDAGKYRLYFQLKSFDKTMYRVYTAETTQAITDPAFAFTLANSGNPVLEPGSGTWDGKLIMHPWVIKDNGVYYMYYSGGVPTGVGIGVAKSTDGYAWVKGSGNPIFAATGESVVINDGGIWRMWYLASDTGGPIKYFSSTGPIEFSSIQAAITKAAAGDTIKVAPGTYAENVLVNKFVRIIGSGSSETGTIVNTPTSIDPTLGVFQINASGSSASEPIVLQDIRVLPNGRAGISIGKFSETSATSVSNLKIDNVAVIGTNNNAQTEQERGLFVGPLSTLDHLTVINSAFNNLAYGWYLQKAVSADTSTVSNISVTGTTFNHNNLKGLYAEKLTDAIFTDSTWSENGFNSAGLPSYFIPWMSGVDVNLKAGTYQNITFNNPTITNNALGGAQNGVGIAIKARNDATSYNTYPATLNNVSILGGNVTGNERGVRIGEPGKNNTGPTNVRIENTAIYNNLKTYTGTDGSAYGDVINYSLASVDASPLWFGSAGGPASGKIFGNVTFTPWCADAACTTFMPDANGKIIIPSTFTPDEIQTALNNAPAGTTIVFSGTVPSIVGGYQINNPNLTILLLNGAVIENSSPCFVVNADYTRVTTESLGGAKCVPTNGSHGIDVTGNRVNIIIEGLEIDGTGQTTGDGIHFGGTIQDFQILNNYIHDLDGNGIEFVSQPTGVQDIQGNLFNFITAVGILSPSSLNAEYNSWGNWTSAANSGAVDAIPWTHADITITETGTTWANLVMPGNNISFRVSANLREVMGVEFKLPIPTGFTLVSATPVSPIAFDPAHGSSVLDITVPGVITYAGYKTSAVTGENVPLFDVTLTAPAAGGPFTFAVDGTTDKFGMAPAGGGPSNNIFAASLAGADFGLVTVYPQLSSTDFVGPYAAGYTQQFSLTVDNTALGAVAFDTPQLQFVGLPASTVLEYWDATLATPAWVPVVGGIQNLPASAAGSTATYTFRVTFASAASISATINLVDTHFTNILDTLDAAITVNPNYTVTGTFSMQGRSVRSGILVTLTSALYGAKSGLTLDILSDNLSLSNVAVATYVITTNQPRYLDVPATLGKTIDVSSGKTSMNPLQLIGGDANNDDIEIGLGDATVIGGAYNQPGGDGITADVNFSGLVDIFDLTIVGGNYNLTSAVYASWLP